MGKNFKYYSSISYEDNRRNEIRLKMKEKNEETIVKAQKNIGFISSVFNKFVV